MSTLKQKRNRISIAVTNNVEYKIRQLEKVLGVTKFDKKWNDIKNESKKLALGLI